MTWMTTYKDMLDAINGPILAKYMAHSHDTSPSADNEIPRYGEEYLDAAMANILLKGMDPGYPISANMAEMVTAIAYEGLKHHGILHCDICRQEFCGAFALNTLPDNHMLYDYYIWIHDHAESDMTYWVLSTLLLFGFLPVGPYDRVPYRSRVMAATAFYLEFCPNISLETDRFKDNLHIHEKMERIIQIVLRDRLVCERGEYTACVADMFRELSWLLFSTILGHGSVYPDLVKLGKSVFCQRLTHHQRILDEHYKRRNNQGEHT